MTIREQEVLDLIKKNPLASQQELADALGITRSSAAVHIANLINKGVIIGKGYVVKDDPYVCIVGGTNIDIQGFPKNNLILNDSNPGQVKLSSGGVGRNIGENLVKLDVAVKLISVVGGDTYGTKIVEEAMLIGLDMRESLILRDQSTSTYLSVLDESGDMAIAISHMDIFDKMDIEFIKTKKQVINNAKICVIDTNIPRDVIEYIVTNYRNTDFFLDTVSTTKALKIRDLLGYFHTIKPNHIEAEMLTGISINCRVDMDKAAQHFFDLGVKRVFITMGSDGVYYNDQNTAGVVVVPPVEVINATGAGDAFLAAIVNSHFNDCNIEYATRFAIAASSIAIAHEDTINPYMSLTNVDRRMKESLYA